MEDSNKELNSGLENRFTFFICPCWLDSTTSRRFADGGNDYQKIKNPTWGWCVWGKHATQEATLTPKWMTDSDRGLNSD